MNREQLMAQIDSAKQHTAESAITNPGIYHPYGNWVAAKKSLEIAKRNLQKAESAWLAMIEPALADPLLKKLAKRKGLIPTTPQPRPDKEAR
jgi:hypothetical protein